MNVLIVTVKMKQCPLMVDSVSNLFIRNREKKFIVTNKIQVSKLYCLGWWNYIVK